jgi:hypothetical protein
VNDKYPNQNEILLSLVSDERFLELTGGLEKNDIHPLLVGMRDMGSCGVRVEG